MKNLYRKSTEILVAVVVLACSVNLQTSVATAASQDIYKITWKFYYEYAGEEGSPGVAANPPFVAGQDAFNTKFHETAAYEGEAVVKTDGSAVTIEDFTTKATRNFEDSHTWSRYPGWECQGDPSDPRYAHQALSGTYTRQAAFTDPDKYVNDPNPPQIFKIYTAERPDGTKVMEFPLKDDPRIWEFKGVENSATTACGGSVSQQTNDFSYDYTGDNPWREGPGLPEGLREGLVSDDGGKTYELHTTKTKILPGGSFTITPFTQTYTIDLVATRQSGFNILSPSDGSQISKHMESVQPGTIDFSWQGVAEATAYQATIQDKTTGSYKMQNDTMGLATNFTRPTKEFDFGHEYEFAVKAITPSGEHTDQVTFKIKILPDLTDPLAQSMENGTNVTWTNVTPDLITARDAFVSSLQAKNWTITYNSAYRPLQYQEHLYLIVHNLKDSHISAADRALLTQEKARHGLGSTVAKPKANAPHTKGVAFDATIFDENGNPLNSLGQIDGRLLDLAKAAGFKKPPTNDYVHFELKDQ